MEARTLLLIDVVEKHHEAILQGVAAVAHGLLEEGVEGFLGGLGR